MKPSVLICSGILASTLIIGGCDDRPTSDHPDRSSATAAKVDDIKRNARDQINTIDKDYDQTVTRLEFHERQIREKYKADRETFAIAADKQAADRNARRREIEIKAKYDKEEIDTELAEKLKTTSAEDVAAVKANAVNRKAEVDSRAAAKLAPILTDIQRAEADARQPRGEFDRKEAGEISALEEQRRLAQDQMRAKKVKVDRWVTDELAKVEKESAVNKQ